MLNKEQKLILDRSGIEIPEDFEIKISPAIEDSTKITRFSDVELEKFVMLTNALYRGGKQIVSDGEYDQILIPELKRRMPYHPFLKEVEPEFVFRGKKTKLPFRMLSTDKAYTFGEIKNWIVRIEKKAKEIDYKKSIKFRVTPKLDGFAAYYDGSGLFTRGDGKTGTDISRVLHRGLKVTGKTPNSVGPGEIVIKKSYFLEFLSNKFENSRNFQAALLSEKEISEDIKKAIKVGAARFVLFDKLDSWEGTEQKLLNDFDEIVEDVISKVPYDVDGSVLEVKNKEIRDYLGSTDHHNRWQIAFKANIEKKNVLVIDVLPQTSRTGRVNPVVLIEPTRLSGATIKRISAHHYGMVEEEGLGKGSRIEIVRSGLVIPKIEKVLVGVKPRVPAKCPSCESALEWDSEHLYLMCPNSHQCAAQIENTLEYFFKTIGNIDGFGPETISKLYAHGVKSIYDIYQLSEKKLIDLGFGEKTSTNLINELERSKVDEILDSVFLAAFGVNRLGKGNSNKLLEVYRLEDIFSLTPEMLSKVEGFAKKSSKKIVEGLSRVEPEYSRLFGLRFNIKSTSLLRDLMKSGTLSKIAGKRVVFTGTMVTGKRNELEANARLAGAKVSSSVSGSTDYLVTGENVGPKKIGTAKNKGVSVISEKEYMKLIGS